MTIALSGELGHAFRRSSSKSYRASLALHEKNERERHERKDSSLDEADVSDALLVFVTAGEIASALAELDKYDAATIAALHENEIQLTEARRRVEEMLPKAHVLPDGRRVFETEDGLRVFDEHGNELDNAVVTPDEIDDARPRWEAFNDLKTEVVELEQERRDLFEYQAKLDLARERLDAGDLTRSEFDQLRADLVDEMPVTVRAQFPELAPEIVAPAVNAVTPGEVLTISDDMIAPSFKPAPR